jgi:hypothetical protein
MEENIQNDSQKNLKQQLRKQVSTYLMAALGFVAGLAWNEAIKGVIDRIFPFSGNGIIAKFVYAILVTIIIILFALYISKDDDK